jgi:predicted dehydrogenase
VIVEKPFTSTIEEGEELIKLAKEKSKLLSVYQNRRYDSDYKAIKKVVDEHLLGTLIEAEFHYDRFTEQLSYKVHKETPTPGVGIVYDLGSHLIDQALTLFGMPASVFADIDILRHGSKVDDYFELLMFYDHFRVRIHSSLLVREPLPAYIIHGTKGSFIKAKTDVQEIALQAGNIPNTPDWGKEPENEQGLLHTEKDGKIIREYLPSFQGNYMDYYDGIYKALRLGQAPPVTAEEGLNVINIITAAHESSRVKKVFKM